MKAIFTCTLFVAMTLPQIALSQTVVSTLVDNFNSTFADDMIFDAAGNLYCADYSGDAVFKRTPDGVVTQFVGGMSTPNGLAFNTAGELYICDNAGNRIYVVDQSGVYLDTIIASKPSGIIKMATSDTMIFTTYGAQDALRKLAPDGTITDFYVGTPLNGAVGLEYCAGELYVANFNDRKIFRVDGDTLTLIAQLPGSGYLGFLSSIGGQLLATSFNGHKIYKVDPVSQSVDLYAGSSLGSIDGGLDSAKFTTPNGIVVSPAEDTIYISEYSTGRLRAISGFTLGVPEATFAEFHAYPNPMAESLTILVNDDSRDYALRLVDLSGKSVKQFTTNYSHEVTISVSDVEPGVFFLLAEIDGKTQMVSKLVKRN